MSAVPQESVTVEQQPNLELIEGGQNREEYGQLDVYRQHLVEDVPSSLEEALADAEHTKLVAADIEAAKARGAQVNEDDAAFIGSAAEQGVNFYSLDDDGRRIATEFVAAKKVTDLSPEAAAYLQGELESTDKNEEALTLSRIGMQSRARLNLDAEIAASQTYDHAQNQHNTEAALAKVEDSMKKAGFNLGSPETEATKEQPEVEAPATPVEEATKPQPVAAATRTRRRATRPQGPPTHSTAVTTEQTPVEASTETTTLDLSALDISVDKRGRAHDKSGHFMKLSAKNLQVLEARQDDILAGQQDYKPSHRAENMAEAPITDEDDAEANQPSHRAHEPSHRGDYQAETTATVVDADGNEYEPRHKEYQPSHRGEYQEELINPGHIAPEDWDELTDDERSELIDLWNAETPERQAKLLADAKADPESAPEPAEQKLVTPEDTKPRTLRKRFNDVLAWASARVGAAGYAKTKEYFNDEEKGDRRKRVAAVVLGAGALLGVAYTAHKFGHHSGSEIALTAPGTAAAQDIAPHITIQPEHVEHMKTLQSGHNIWNDARDILHRHGLEANRHNTDILKDHILHSNHLSEAQAHDLPVGFDYSVPSAEEIADMLKKVKS
jgi:hypothetical protein